jgi:murein DD-endopeptidase / murein LD-carboxypeptidase
MRHPIKSNFFLIFSKLLQASYTYCFNLFSILALLVVSFGCKSHRNHSQILSQETISKYATLTGVPESTIQQQPELWKFVNEWYGTSYRYGGKDKNGIDCSAFVCKMAQEVFKKELSGSANDLYDASIKLKDNEVTQGDFVFFKIESKKISHVGMYLFNGKFIHASVSKGVIISDINETYYKKYFYSFGRN